MPRPRPQTAAVRLHGGRSAWLTTLFVCGALAALAGACSDDVKQGAATGTADAAVHDVVVDVAHGDAQLDAPSDEDSQPDTQKPLECPGAAGCPCNDNTDCDDALCVETPNGRLCAARCVEACPTGQSCRNVTGGADAQSFCVPTWGALCRPCDANTDCAQPGLVGAKCVAHGDAGGFCGAACSSAADCPDDHACANATDVAGGATKQCVPTGDGPGGFGLCGCTPYARAQGLSTTCWLAEKGQGGESLLCKGSRQCATDGLSACSKITGAAAQCLDAQCAGKPDATSCDDGDSCTLEDVCKAGVCTGGVLVCECTKTADCAKKEDGDPCNGTLYCDTSGAKPKCVVNPASVVSCTTTKDTACRKNVCQPADGTCALQDAPVGAPCDDGGPCTGNDTCDGKGTCAPGKVDLCQCKTDQDCAAQDDGDACNGTLYCKKTATTALCVVNPATQVTCPTAADTACVKAQCQPATGLCLPTPVSATAGATAGATVACEDGNPCTVGEVCDKGVCKAGPKANKCDCGKDADCVGKNGGDQCLGELFCNVPVGKCEPNPGLAVACTTVNDTDCLKTSCDAKTGTCTAKPTAKGTPCDADGTSCTASDACDQGACVAGTQVCVCQSDTDCADKEDGNLCNGTLYCDKSGPAPQCKVNPATLKTCPSVDNTACVQNLCQPKSGLCAKTQAADGAPCDDGDVCSAGDACVQGSCKPGFPACPCKSDGDCAKFDDDLCDGPKACKALPGGKTACVDVPGQPVDCSGVASGTCEQATCAAKTGNCVVSALADGVQCSGSACAGPGACKAGVCAGGASKSCDDGNSCTADSCAAGKGCVHDASLTSPCDDGNACTEKEVCKGGTCGPGAAKQCTTTAPCTVASCVPAKGCVTAPSTASCDDGAACTVGDKCADGKCAGTAKDCDDKDPGTTDSCDPKTGACVHVGSKEICDNVDNDKDGATDEGCDDDGDGHCDKDMEIPKGVSPKVCPKGQDDCDDTAAWRHVGAVEACGNGVDEDCDGSTDEACDFDGDGFCTAKAPLWGNVGCFKSSWPNASCTTNVTAPIRGAPPQTVTIAATPTYGGYMPRPDELWLVADGAGGVTRVALSGAQKGAVVGTFKSGVYGMRSLIGEPRADVWFTTATTDGKTALAKVVGLHHLTWRTGDVAKSYQGLALDKRNVVTVSAGDNNPQLVLFDKVSGAQWGTVSLVKPAGVGSLQGAPVLAAAAGRAYMPPGTSSAAWHGYDLSSGKGIAGAFGAGSFGSQPLALFVRRGRLCGLTKANKQVTCVVVANFDCDGDDCGDAEDHVKPGAVEKIGDAVDNDCDGTTDLEPDSDADGVCLQAGCALQERDHCPGVWNPTNDPGKCVTVEVTDGPRVIGLQLRPKGATQSTSSRERVHEPVEVPLVNGVVNSDVVVHFWGARKGPVSGSSHTVTVGSSPTFVDGLVPGDGAGLPMGEGAKSLVVKATDSTLAMPRTELTMGGWFNVSANVTKVGTLIHLRDGLIADLGLSGTGQDLGTPTAHVSTSNSPTPAKGMAPLSKGWHHLALVFNGLETRLYVDGGLADSKPAAGTLLKATAAQRTFSVGGSDTNYDRKADSQLVAGHTAEVLVMSRALSPAEIRAWASSKAVYGSVRTPGARKDFDDLRVVEQSSTGDRHVPFALVGAAPHAGSRTHQVATWLDFDGKSLANRGSGENAEKSGALTWVQGRWGEPLGAVVVGGGASGAYVNTNEANALVIPDVAKAEKTVELWTKLKADTTGTLFGSDFTSAKLGALYLALSSNKLTVQLVSDKGELSFQTKETVPTGRWTHIALTLNQGAVDLYVDGLRVGGGVFVAGGKITPTQGPYIGARNVAGQAKNALSHLTPVDDVLVHTRALTAAEIRDHAVGLPRVRFLAGTHPAGSGGKWLVRSYALRWGGSTLRPEATQTRRLSNGAYVVCDGLLSSCIGYRGLWAFNQSASSGTAVDLSGGARHGVVDGVGQAGPGADGAALWLSATRHLSLSSDTLHGLDDLTVDARFTIGSVSNPMLLSFASANEIGLNVSYEKTSGVLRVQRGTKSVKWSFPMVNNTFAAATVTRQTGSVTVAKDGATLTGIDTLAGALTTQGALLNIGNIAPTALANRQFDGGIDLLRVMSRAIKPPERLSTVPMTAQAPWVTAGKLAVPTQRFVQGCNAATYAACKATQGPEKVVWTSRFAIDATEVTAAEYKACVDAGVCPAAGSGSLCTGSDANKTAHPVNCLQRKAAQTYCEWRGGSLPTEAQWVHAARGSCGPMSLTDSQCASMPGARRVFPWGDTATDCNVANHWVVNGAQSCASGTTAVGSKPQGRSPYGGLDFAGNVAEFVLDGYDLISNLPNIDPVKAQGNGALVCGGGYLAQAAKMAISYRSQQATTYSNAQAGFRCAY